MNISRKTYIIIGIGIGIAIFVLVCITLIAIFAKSSDDHNSPTNPPITEPDEIPLPFTRALIVRINNSALWARDIDHGGSSFVVKNWTAPFDSFDFYLKKNIYFISTVAGEAITSFSKRYSQLTQPGKWNAKKIAVDHVHEKVYVLDELAAKINVFDIQSGYYNVISISLFQPNDIAIDPEQRCLFVLQLSSILKMKLDGSSPKTILKRADILAFQIDADIKRIYWATISSIESSDYAGEKVITVEKISSEVISLAVSNNRLIWLNSSNKHEKATLWFCKVTDRICKDSSSAVFDDNAVEIKAYNFKKTQVTNPCKGRNNCEHMCINSNNKPKCVCTMGTQLKSDSQSCETIDAFLLYVQGDFVKGRVLDFSEDTFSEAIFPFKLNTTLKKKEVVSIDFNTRSHDIIFSDDCTTNKINLKPGNQQILMGGEVLEKQINPAVDWITQSAYFVRNYSWVNMDIAVRKIDPYDSSKAEKIVLYISFNQTPKSLVVHPNRGLLFVTLTNPAQKKPAEIVRANLDGSERTTVGKNLSVSESENGLAIDYEEDRLCWFNEDMKEVHSADLNGFNLQTIDVSIVENPTMINVYGDYVYITNLTSIWRFNKKTGGDSRKILPNIEYESQRIRGARVISAKSQIVEDNHPCAVKNGGCKRYCFAKPRKSGKLSRASELEKVCGCNNDERLDSDGKNCSPREKEHLSFFY